MKNIDRPSTLRPDGQGALNGQPPLIDRLIEHLRRADLTPGDHLKEQELADALGVSRTPIRRILRSLAEKEFVEPREKRGYFMLISSEDLFEPSIELPVINEKTLFDRITLDRLCGEMPDEFDHDFIANRYGVSLRMSERVVNELKSEGLIQTLSQRRHCFNPALLSSSASDASYAFRLVIETAIPLLPDFNIEPAQLGHARRVHEKFIREGDTTKNAAMAYQIDANFHEMIGAGSRNSHFQSAIMHQNRLRKLMEYRDFNDLQRVDSWCHEHLEIIEAFEAEDYQKASTLIRKHLTNAMSYRPR